MANFSPRSSSQQPIAAIGFDLDGSLFDRRGAMSRMLVEWPGLDPDSIQAIVDQDDEGRTPRRAFFSWWLKSAPQGREHAAMLSKTFQRRLLAAIRPDVRMLALLTDLQAAAVPLALLSNGSPAFQKAKLRACGAADSFPLRRQLYSKSLGYEKPDVRAFHALASTLELPPQEILFCGDDPQRDLAGAKEAGMSALLIQRDNSGTIPPEIFAAIRRAIRPISLPS